LHRVGGFSALLKSAIGAKALLAHAAAGARGPERSGDLESSVRRQEERKIRSLLRCWPGFVLLVVALVDSSRAADPDLWGHIRFGQEVFKLGHPIFYDRYSYSVPGHPVIDYEWLSQVLLAAVFQLFGVVGLKLMKLTVSAAVVCLVAVAEAESGGALWLQACVLAVTAIVLRTHMVFRPQIFTFLMFAAAMLILARDRYRGRAPVWLLIPIMALWANLHGGFVMGVAALFVYAIACIVAGAATATEWKHGGRLLGYAAAAAFATLLTPYGIGNWLAVARTIRDPWTRNVLTEWWPLWKVIAFTAANRSVLSMAYLYCFCVVSLMAALAGSWLLLPRARGLPLDAVAAMTGVATLIATRNAPLFVIAAAVPVVGRLAAVVPRASYEQPRTAFRSGATVRRYAAQLLAVALAVLLSAYTGLFSRRLRAGIPVPAGAVAFMSFYGLHGNVLCDYNWGEYLIWHAWPQSRVFADGRYDTVYPQKVIRDSVAFQMGLPGGARVLEAYPHDFVLVPVNSVAALTAQQSGGWVEIYSDRTAVLFARAGSPAASLAGNGIIEAQPPEVFP
jgi:hypothetical protein